MKSINEALTFFACMYKHNQIALCVHQQNVPTRPCLLLGLRQDTVRLQHVVGRRVPQPQMHRPTGGEKPVIVRVKRHPRRGKPVVLGRLFYLLGEERTTDKQAERKKEKRKERA